MNNPPAWADTLVDLVMVHEGIQAPPDLTWSADPLPPGAHALASEGITAGNLIVIGAGASERDARHTLMHELAHWVTGAGHHEAMYAKLYELTWLFGEKGDLEYARAREAIYQPAPSERGWSRFISRVTSWAARAEEYVEMLAGFQNSNLGVDKPQRAQ